MKVICPFQVYGGEARISTLRKLFPLMEDKKSLASAEERAQIKGKASLLAAVDYYVGMHSDIFISASPGNMHNALVSLTIAHLSFLIVRNTCNVHPSRRLWGDNDLCCEQVGHRTYENMKTIRPSMPLLGQLFLNKNISWSEFEEAVIEGHKNRQGQIRLRKPKQSLYTYPASDCMCGA